jgi:hypothetical protein
VLSKDDTSAESDWSEIPVLSQFPAVKMTLPSVFFPLFMFLFGG